MHSYPVQLSEAIQNSWAKDQYSFDILFTKQGRITKVSTALLEQATRQTPKKYAAELVVKEDYKLRESFVHIGEPLFYFQEQLHDHFPKHPEGSELEGYFQVNLIS